MISIKSNEELDLMRKAGSVVADIITRLRDELKPGITTKSLDEKALKIIKDSGCDSAFYNYKGFPGNICASINNVVVHGIPGKQIIKDGDIISIDVGVKYKGYYGDAAATFGVGKISKEAQRLMDVTEKSLNLGIEKAISGNRLFDISSAIQQYVESNGYSVVRAFVGHGIGQKMHEAPEVPNYGKAGQGVKLEKGMVLAIEPTVNAGSFEIEIMHDGWTALTKDRSLSAHFEHTIVIDDKKAEILTLWEKKNQ